MGSLTLGVGTSDSVLKFHGFSTGGGPPRAEVVLWTDDVDKAFSSLIEKGVKPLSAPHDFAGIVRVAWVTDPDGNPVQIVSKTKAR